VKDIGVDAIKATYPLPLGQTTIAIDVSPKDVVLYNEYRHGLLMRCLVLQDGN
jgi:hypothetical protein